MKVSRKVVGFVLAGAVALAGTGIKLNKLLADDQLAQNRFMNFNKIRAGMTSFATIWAEDRTSTNIGLFRQNNGHLVAASFTKRNGEIVGRFCPLRVTLQGNVVPSENADMYHARMTDEGLFETHMNSQGGFARTVYRRDDYFGLMNSVRTETVSPLEQERLIKEMAGACDAILNGSVRPRVAEDPAFVYRAGVLDSTLK